MKKAAKKILEILNNNHTKVEEREDFKGNYYSYITDTIYLSTNNDIKNENKKHNITKETNSLVVMCHEAVHSIQNKALHILNSIFSNISVILGLVCIVLFVVKRTNLVLSIITLVSLIMSIITRLVLEVEAVNKSVILAKEIVLQDVVNNVKLEELTNAKEYINKNKIIALLNMVIGKIVLFLIVLLIMII